MIHRTSRITWRADGDANFYTLVKPGKWFARIQLNGEMTVLQHQDILDRIAEALNATGQNEYLAPSLNSPKGTP